MASCQNPNSMNSVQILIHISLLNTGMCHIEKTKNHAISLQGLGSTGVNNLIQRD